MLDAALSAADEALLDRRVFVLDDEAYDRFVATLAVTVADEPKLRALMDEKSPWEV